MITQETATDLVYLDFNKVFIIVPNEITTIGWKRID